MQKKNIAVQKIVVQKRGSAKATSTEKRTKAELIDRALVRVEQDFGDVLTQLARE